MSLRECLRMAVSGLSANKLRSALTVLGVVIGVAAVIDTIAIGEGARRSVERSLEMLGSNLITVMPGRMDGSGEVLTNDLWMGLRKKCPSLTGLAPETSVSATVKAGAVNASTSVVGTVPEWAKVRGTHIDLGDFFKEEDVDSGAKVAVLGRTVVKDLGLDNDPIGSRIRINGLKFTIVGVLEAKGQMGPMDQDDRIIIPITTHQKRLKPSKSVQILYCQASTSNNATQAQAELQEAIGKDLEPDRFFINNFADMRRTAADSSRTFSGLLAGIAGVSLLVGGIGIMNIMLVSVTERTREIGLCKALGANPTDIRLQFVTESVVLSLMGGFAGIFLGFCGTAVLSRFGGWEMVVNARAIMASFAFSVAVGLFFGIYPAVKAAGLLPMVALKYE